VIEAPSTAIAQEMRKGWGVLPVLGMLYLIAGRCAIDYSLAAPAGIVMLVAWVLVSGALFRFFEAFATRRSGDAHGRS